MIILISWPVVLLCLGVWAVFTAICAVIYGIQNSWDDERVKWLKPFSVKEKWGLFGILLTIFAGVGAFLYGWFYHNGYAAIFGLLGAIVASVAAAYICSPLKWDWESAGGMGCNPIGTLVSLASLAVVVAFAWIFILIAIFRKSTWRLYVGIVVAIGLFIAGAMGGLVLYENAERNKTLENAEQYIASGLYEKAMDIYQNLSEEELYLQTKYEYAQWHLENKEYYKSIQVFTELAEEADYADAREQVTRVNYLWGCAKQEEKNYSSAANIFEKILDYKDARERYQLCCYTQATDDAGSLISWEKAVEWFQKAGDYQDASQLAIYYQARILGQENLMDAEALLRQLPRDYLDVDIMLTAIETYGSWGGVYNLTEASGKDTTNYTKAELVLVYHRLHSPADAHIKLKVVLYRGTKGTSYYSDGVMPQNGTLKFKTGVEGSFWNHFTVTKQKLTYVDEAISKYGGSDTATYQFTRG